MQNDTNEQTLAEQQALVDSVYSAIALAETLRLDYAVGAVADFADALEEAVAAASV